MYLQEGAGIIHHSISDEEVNHSYVPSLIWGIKLFCPDLISQPSSLSHCAAVSLSIQLGYSQLLTQLTQRAHAQPIQGKRMEQILTGANPRQWRL